MKCFDFMRIALAIAVLGFASCNEAKETFEPQPQEEETRAAAVISNPITVTSTIRKEKSSGGGYTYEYWFEDITFTAAYPLESSLTIRADIQKTYVLSEDIRYYDYFDYIYFDAEETKAYYTHQVLSSVSGPGISLDDMQSWSAEVGNYRFRSISGTLTPTYTDHYYTYSFRW